VSKILDQLAAEHVPVITELEEWLQAATDRTERRRLGKERRRAKRRSGVPGATFS